MKDIRPGLFAYLAADVVISALVTANGISRIYPIRIPQGVKAACIVCTRISGAADYKMEGPTGYARRRWQIAAWAPGALEAGQLANAVMDALSGFKGVWGTGVNSVDVQGVFCVDQHELYDDIVQLYGVSRDYFIHHGEL